jgi:hypothetical protein
VAANTFSTIRATYNLATRDATLLIDNISLTNFTINPTTIQGGGSIQGTVTINQPAPPSGAFVNLSTTDATNVLLPDEDPSTAGNQVLVNGNATSRTFTIGTGVVLATITPTISATRGGAPINRVLTITPVDFTMTITPNSVLGGNSATLKITLTGVAPAGGVPITMSKSAVGAPDVTGNVILPSVTVSAGNTTQNFIINTTSVSVTGVVKVQGQIATNIHSQNLTVRAPQVVGITFAPSVVRGGIQTTTMTITLDGPAPAGGAVVSLNHTPNPQIANIPNSVTIPAGQSSNGGQIILTNKVSRTLATNVQASFGGGTATATLTVTR